MSNQLVVLDTLSRDRKLMAAFNNRRVSKEMQLRVELDYAKQIIQANDQLAGCTEDSIKLALLDAASAGLSLAPRLGHAYLIPYKNTATFAPGYRGFEFLVLRAGTVKRIQTNLVHEKDPVFEVWTDETGTHVKHVTNRGARGEVTHAYTIATYANGEHHVEVMERWELNAVEEAAKARPRGGKVWRTKWKGEMQKKAVVRRAAKHWPQDDDGWLAHALNVVDKHDPIFEPETIDEQAQELMLNDEQVLELHAMLTDHGLAPERADRWLKNKAQAMGRSEIGNVPAEHFEEIKEFFRGHLEKQKNATTNT